MAAGGHFGCPKFTFDGISGHFTSIRSFVFWIFWQYGRRRPFWMSEIHFRSHCWPFLIDTQLYFFWKFLTKWLPSAILDVRNSLLILFLAILDQYGFFVLKFFTNWLPVAILDVHFWPFQIDRPFWMSEIHCRWHFWTFQIHTDLNF